MPLAATHSPATGAPPPAVSSAPPTTTDTPTPPAVTDTPTPTAGHAPPPVAEAPPPAASGAPTPASDAYGDEDCGIRDLLDRLGDKWTILVLSELSQGVRRFRELEHAIPGISQRMLSLTTKRLCRDGLIERTAYPTIPPQVDYRLTPVGRSFATVLIPLVDWSRTHKPVLDAARAAWDADRRDTGRRDTD